MSADNPAELAGVIEEFYHRKVDGALNMTPQTEFVKRYDRRHLTRNLAGLFDRLVGINSSRPKSTANVA